MRVAAITITVAGDGRMQAKVCYTIEGSKITLEPIEVVPLDTVGMILRRASKCAEVAFGAAGERAIARAAPKPAATASSEHGSTSRWARLLGRLLPRASRVHAHEGRAA